MLGLLGAILLFGSAWVLDRAVLPALPDLPELGQPAFLTDLVDLDDEPVLILVVGSTNAVAVVRRRVEDTRVLSENRGAFALKEGRIVAARTQDAGPLLEPLGWSNRPLEILSKVASAHRPGGKSAGEADDETPGTGKHGSLAMDLVDQPSLSASEAMKVLQEMERNGDI
jgi:hypothetical protein